MLTVYTYPAKAPKDCINLSGIPLDTLVESALSVYHHQKHVKIWFGYLDGWMLSPHEETLLRKVIRAFPCSVVSCFPIAFSHAWKNEIDTIYTEQLNGVPDTHDNGCSVYNGGSTGHEQTGK